MVLLAPGKRFYIIKKEMTEYCSRLQYIAIFLRKFTNKCLSFFQGIFKLAFISNGYRFFRFL